MATSNKPPVYVVVSALDAGHLTLPESHFVTDAEPGKRATVPSLSFLIQHASPSRTKTTKLVFDLGVKRNLNGYTPAQRAHIAQRQPVIVVPDCADSLRNGNTDNSDTKEPPPLLDPATDIDLVILSHVHWDHVGTSSDFSSATVVVGAGTLDVLKNGAGPLYPAELFNDDELPTSRTVELPPLNLLGDIKTGSWTWQPLAGFDHVLDLFGDGSVYVIDSPGHLYGHVNLLARISESKYVYLGGDCCHDPRILSGEKGIAMYADGRGGMRSVHVDTDVAERTVDKVREFAASVGPDHLRKGGDEVVVEVVVAHDGVWREKNRDRFWPGRL
ncbi:beta-lactamase-like protein [Bombardia bombarda]|uniref:Beta-lactamase-like protein n=1 Tax=Bombardia bombarda TaxID=252184 RepID=A0AA40C9P6_9PEZI|nr:beta-lactamase-like protein [Bombardia bombarda]